MLTEYAEDLGSLPEEYPIALRVGDGPERLLRHRTGAPLETEIAPGDLAPGGGTRVTSAGSIRPTPWASSPAVRAAGADAVLPAERRQGPARLLLALLPLCAAGAALSTFLGAPVGIAGALLFALLARCTGWIREMADYALAGTSRAARASAEVLERLAAVLPDLSRYDLTVQVVARWDIRAGSLLALVPMAIAWSAVFLLAGLAVRAAGRLR